MTLKKKCMLIILDGWGVRDESHGNAVTQAATPNLNQLLTHYPSSLLTTFGNAVGLPEGIMGNSEVGHLNIGAGRIVYQDLLRIDRAIADGRFFENAAICQLMQKIQAAGSTLHLMGLVSDGGVHSQLTHLLALLDMAAEKKIKPVAVHAIMDGRDTSPTGGAGYLQTLQSHLDRIGSGTIATICGRYFAMDRDKRWDRIEKAFRLYTRGEGTSERNALAAIQNAYQKNETDEFIKPIVITDADGMPRGQVKDGDGILFFNFRADRAREITRAFTDESFDEFERDPWPNLCGYTCMTLYDAAFTLPIAFEPKSMQNILGQVISDAGLKQLRIAETEKYAHVTYFFSGGREEPFPGEDRRLIPSPREVATYDQKPEMSARKVTHEVLERLDSDQYDLIVLNFANMDMVGHTGDLAAAVKACETVDQCIGQIVAKLQEKQWSAIITADHGNAEKMISDDGNPHTAHTVGRVNCILVDDDFKGKVMQDGALCDIAPTLLKIMGLPQPAEMTGKSLIAASDRPT